MPTLPLAILLAISMAASTPLAQPEPPTGWANRVDSGTGPDAITNLHFYFHDIPSGRNPTAVQIIKPAATASDSNAAFGAAVMIDDALTETADASSKVVGRAQGMYTFSSQNESAIIMSMSLGFTDGDYNGSSLSVMGKNSVFAATRELPVVGGTGVFRMARGYAVLKTVTFNTTTGDAVVDYNVTVYAPAAASGGGQALPAAGAPATSKSLTSSAASMVMRGRWWWVVSAATAIGAAALL